MYEKNFPHRRYKNTLDFLHKHIPEGTEILDLGIQNPLSERMRDEGYEVTNTSGEDLDLDFTNIVQSQAPVVTAFEIFEHLLAPFNVLREIKAERLVASVPLKLWFAPAYRSKEDMRDRHYHEFEPWQFDWLLEKSGWEIKDSKKWANPVRKFGIRPLLRTFTPRYYIVYAERKSSP